MRSLIIPYQKLGFKALPIRVRLYGMVDRVSGRIAASTGRLEKSETR
jgi:uncharacterized membrane-anchored protein